MTAMGLIMSLANVFRPFVRCSKCAVFLSVKIMLKVILHESTVVGTLFIYLLYSCTNHSHFIGGMGCVRNVIDIPCLGHMPE